jgi:hypothetical protein
MVQAFFDRKTGQEPVDIFAQRQHVRVARPTPKAFDQEQSIAAVLSR